jgi:diaminopimelate epimerase
MTNIKITKMQGCGNDFVVLDYEEYLKSGLSMDELAIKLCDRHFGIGADGMIIPDTKPNGQTDIAWYFYNNDGSTAQMCGNGMRCFAKYVWDRKLVKNKSFSVKTLAGVIKPEIQEDGTVKVNMGTPILEESKIPFKGERTVQLKDKSFDIIPVSMGNPHCIIFTEENPLELAQNYGPIMEKHPYFPEKTNTEFVKVLSKNEIEMRVFERGCGITLACGTGACASVVACVLNNLTEQKVKVNLLGGAVNVEWSGTSKNPNENIYLIGPAEYSFVADYML